MPPRGKIQKTETEILPQIMRNLESAVPNVKRKTIFGICGFKGKIRLFAARV